MVSRDSESLGFQPWIRKLDFLQDSAFWASMITGIVGGLLTLPLIRWIVPSNCEHLNGKSVIAAVCLALYFESLILLARVKSKNDSDLKLFLARSLMAYAAALTGGQVAGILSIWGRC